MARENQSIRPTTKGVAITPHDSTEPGYITTAIYVGSVSGGADLIYVPEGQTDTVTLKNVLAGNYYPIAARRVHSTGTTATFLVAWYNDENET